MHTTSSSFLNPSHRSKLILLHCWLLVYYHARADVMYVWPFEGRDGEDTAEVIERASERSVREKNLESVKVMGWGKRRKGAPITSIPAMGGHLSLHQHLHRHLLVNRAEKKRVASSSEFVTYCSTASTQQDSWPTLKQQSTKGQTSTLYK